jgi:hypothetical protein
MRTVGFCTRRVCDWRHDRAMDIVAVLLGIVMFAVLLALIYGIERI